MTPPENDLRDAVARGWNPRCEMKGARGQCRAPDGCHCREIAALNARALTAETDLAKARADLERVTAENADWRHQWEEMAELVCEFAAEKAPDAIALVGADRDGWRKRALVAAEAMTRLAERADTAEAENTRLRALLVERGSGLAWRSMDTAPNGVPIYAKHKPMAATPNGWVALIQRREDDPDEGRGCGRDTILHYNGDATMRGFYGVWEGWLWPEELTGLAALDKAPTPKEPA